MSSETGLAGFMFLLCLAYLSHEDPFQTCNRYTSFGYGYTVYFEMREANFSPNLVFYLEFYVKTSSDAHIMLKADGEEDYGYEIVIGGGSNTFSQIRQLHPTEKKTVITQKTENFLSADDYRDFWISIDKLGIVSVGKKKDDEVFINWKFDNPVPVKYFSFGSWTNMKADWRFGCEKRKDSDVIREERKLSPLQRLKRDLFTLYDPNALPVEKNATLEVKVTFQINNVQLDEKRGEFTMFGSGNLEWHDPKIKWERENYDGIEVIYVPPFQIWTPSIRVLNALALDRSPLFDLTAAGVIAKYDGSIFWRPPFKSVSFCVLDLEYWPFDVHNCSVLFGFWMEPSNLVLTIMDEQEILSKDRTETSWEVEQAIPFNMYHPDEDENYGILHVTVKRAYGPQALILTVPYVASVVMSLTSFWVPLNSSKLHLSCGSLAIILLTLFLGGKAVPAMTRTVPRLLKLYSWSAVIACIPIVLFVALKNIKIYICVPDWISKVLSNGVFSKIFCLPEPNMSLVEYCNLKEEVNKANRDELNVLRLLTVLERIFFLVYLGILIFLVTLF